MSAVPLDAAAPTSMDTPPARGRIQIKTIYLLPQTTEVRCLKRIRWLAREGLKPTTLAFERVGLDIEAGPQRPEPQ